MEVLGTCWGVAANVRADREEALKDDFQFDSGTYGYDESEEEWDDDAANWTGAEDEEEQSGEAKDESTAYLEFLNEEVSTSTPMDIAPCPIWLSLTLTDGSVPETC